MNEIIKAILFGGAGYAIGKHISDEDVKEIIGSYLGAVEFDSLLRDWLEQHPDSDIATLISGYVERNYICLPKKNEYF